jgi:hypothetical protein
MDVSVGQGHVLNKMLLLYVPRKIPPFPLSPSPPLPLPLSPSPPLQPDSFLPLRAMKQSWTLHGLKKKENWFVLDVLGHQKAKFVFT